MKTKQFSDVPVVAFATDTYHKCIFKDVYDNVYKDSGSSLILELYQEPKGIGLTTQANPYWCILYERLEENSFSFTKLED